MKVYLLYSGNAWMNHSSLQLHAICTTLDKACEIANEHATAGDEPLEESELDELREERQTYGREENYLICEAETDELDS